MTREDVLSEKEKNNGESERAGLVYAPAYDASQDIDPDDAPIVSTSSDDVKKLAYYQDLERQRTFKIRMSLIGLVLVMMGALMWMVRDNRNSMVESNAQLNERLNTATVDKMNLADLLIQYEIPAKFAEISERLDAIEAKLGADTQTGR